MNIIDILPECQRYMASAFIGLVGWASRNNDILNDFQDGLDTSKEMGDEELSKEFVKYVYVNYWGEL